MNKAHRTIRIDQCIFDKKAYDRLIKIMDAMQYTVDNIFQIKIHSADGYIHYVINMSDGFEVTIDDEGRISKGLQL